MRITLRKTAMHVASLLGGGFVGYLLFVPLLAIPLEIGMRALLPLLKAIDSHSRAAGAPYFTSAFSVFLMHLPNTILLTLVSVAALRVFPVVKRLAFYSVFIFPAFLQTYYWVEVWRLKRGARSLGLPDAVEQLPTNPDIGFIVVYSLLTYGLFSVALFVLLRLGVKRAASHA